MKIPVILLLLSGLAGVLAAAPRTLPDSEPFVLGVYSAEPQNDETFAMLRDAGINYVQSYRRNEENPRHILDLAQKHQMKVMYDLGATELILRRKAPDWEQEMQRRIDAVKDHPALGMFYLWDEPPTENLPQLARINAMAHEAAGRPTSMVIHWRTNWENTRGTSDVWMADWYPVRGHKFPEESPLDQIGRFIGTAARMRLPGTQFIPVLQMCDFRCFAKDVPPERQKTLRYPNQTEMRYMMQSSMTYGVRGLFFFSLYHSHLNTPEGKKFFHEVFMPLANEVKEFARAVPEVWLPSGRCYDFDYDQKVNFACFVRPGGTFFILTNNTPETRQLDLPMKAIPNAPLNGQLQPWGLTAAKPATLTGGRLKVEASPWESFVWQVK